MAYHATSFQQLTSKASDLWSEGFEISSAAHIYARDESIYLRAFDNVPLSLLANASVLKWRVGGWAGDEKRGEILCEKK